MSNIIITPECVAPTGCKAGQGAVWSPSEGFLWWVDLERAKLHRFNPKTGNARRYDLPLKAATLAMYNGALLMAGERQIGVYDTTTEEFDCWVTLEEEPEGTRINTGGVAPDGNFWFATMDERGLEARANYYVLTTDRKVRSLRLPSVTEPHAMLFSGNAPTMVMTCDTAEQEVIVYDVELSSNAISGRKVVRDTLKEGGQPVGLARDVEGGVWMTVRGGSRLIRFLPDGMIDQVISMSAPKPTTCVFGGYDMRTLFITTSRQGMSFPELDSRPLSGSLFALRVPVPGVPLNAFGESL